MGLRAAALVTVVLLVPAAEASASRIVLAGASTNMGSGSGTFLVNTINGVGLTALDLTANHASTIPSNSWVSIVATLTGNVTFDLGGLYSVDGFSFWNQNNGGPGALGSTGINRVSVLSSLDGITFSFVPGAPVSFAQVMVSGPVGPEIFGFAPVLANFMRFEILSNHGFAGQTGFAEVGFNGVTEVPEPATLSLLGAGLAYAAARRRKRAQP